ncbi:hypothetical protein [Robiginitalea sp. IMCC43444]
MEHIYPHPTDHCKLVSTSEETIRFLTDYSKSLSVIKADGKTFESNLN